jgi:IclR family acetate operon transcriptional repressor
VAREQTRERRSSSHQPGVGARAGTGGQPAGSQTLDRALNVLLEVGRSGASGLGLAECSRLLGYSKPTTHRILRTLTRRGFLEVDDERGVYTLGIANLRLGMAFLHQLDLRREALPLLRQLVEKSRETVHLGVLSGADVVYIEKVESPQAVRMFSQVGHTMPAHSTGIGKAILAHLPAEERAAILPERIESRTPATITSRAELENHFAEVRRRGYSTDDVENEDGIRCVGAPVFDHTGSVCAGISIAGPAVRVTPDRFGELGPLVRATADEISTRIGWVTPIESGGTGLSGDGRP